jgi:hypothetical protein
MKAFRNWWPEWCRHVLFSFSQRHENNPIWNELFELEFDDLEEGKVVIVLYNEAAPQELQVLGYCQLYLQVRITVLFPNNLVSIFFMKHY